MVISDTNKNSSTLIIDDIKSLWKKNFVSFNNISHDIINLIWKFKLESDIKLLGRLFDFYLFEYKEMFLIAYPNSIIRSWYKLRSINDLHIFHKYFIDKDKNTKEIRLYLKSQFNIGQLCRYFFNHEFSSKIFYNDLDKINIKDSIMDNEIILIDKFSENLSNTFTFTTRYSSTKIQINKHKYDNGNENGVNNQFIIKITYRPFQLNNRFKILSSDIPSDVDLILHNLNVLRIDDILELDVINTELIDIIFELHTNNDELKDNLKKIIKLYPELSEYILKKLSLLELEVKFKKIEKDGAFKAFENSLDILLKTIYDKFNNEEYDQSDNMIELNKKIKEKITRIFDSKIII